MAALGCFLGFYPEDGDKARFPSLAPGNAHLANAQLVDNAANVRTVTGTEAMRGGYPLVVCIDKSLDSTEAIAALDDLLKKGTIPAVVLSSVDNSVQAGPSATRFRV